LNADDPAATLEVYVWFEADPADDAAVRAAEDRLAEAMVRGGTDPVGERPRLLRRPDLKQRDGAARATWMEVWPAVPRRSIDGWLVRLATAAASVGATALARGGRHVEPFFAMPAPRVR
jgi:hypothetical protein